MSRTLNEIVKTMQEYFGTEGAIERIMSNDWPIVTKQEAIAMLEASDRKEAMVEDGEVNAEWIVWSL